MENGGDVAGGLLAYLRESLKQPTLEYAEPPTAVAGGFETAIYSFRLSENAALPGPLVLRVFRSHEDPARALYEKAIHNTIAESGYPVPHVHFASRDAAILGGAFVVMDRVAGAPLLDDMLTLRTVMKLRTRVLGFVAKTLAELQVRLHAVDAGGIEAALKAEGLPASAEPGRLSQRTPTFAGQLELLHWRIGNAKLSGMTAGLTWLREHQPQPSERVICHGDFHPLNILSHRGSVSGVIDWSLATVAEPAFDVGNTLMILELAPSGAPGFLRRSTAKRYLGAYQKKRPLDRAAIDYYVAYRCLRSLVWAGETRQARAGVIADRGVNPWHPAEVAQTLIDRFAAVSGVTVTLPGG